MIIQNAIKTPDGTILVSRNRHDFVTHLDANGKRYGVDGGNDYLKRIGDVRCCIGLNLNSSDSIERISENIVWGVRPLINSATPGNKVVYRLLKDLDTEHLKNIARTQRPSIWILMSIFYILEQRGELWK